MKFLLQTLFFFLLVTMFCFGQWVQVGLNNESIKDIAVQNSNIFAVTADSGKLYRSNDNGASWTMIVDSCAVDVAISPTGKVFMIKDSLVNVWWPSALYSSQDNGNTWIWSNLKEQLADSLPYFIEPEQFTISPTGIIFCDIFSGDGVMGGLHVLARSADDGLTWSTPGYNVIGGEIFDFRNNFVLTAGTRYGEVPPSITFYVHLSSNYGTSWNLLESALGWAGNGVLGLFTNGNIIMKSGAWIDTVYVDELFITIDMCNTWIKIASIKSQIGIGLSWSSGLTEGMIIGTDSLGVFLFSDEGDSLGSRNEGLTNLNVQALTLDNNGYVYAGTENGVWRRPLSEIVTSVEENQTSTPSSFNLSQNYPNPFNSATAIQYAIPNRGKVVLKIYDILGKEVTTLINEEKDQGVYTINFDANNLASGLYLYRIQAGSFIDTKKMILLK